MHTWNAKSQIVNNHKCLIIDLSNQPLLATIILIYTDYNKYNKRSCRTITNHLMKTDCARTCARAAGNPPRALSYRESTPQPSCPSGGGTSAWAYPEDLHGRCLCASICSILSTFDCDFRWPFFFFTKSHFATMLSLDFLDDVRRMNKRQVGNTGSFHRTLLLLLCMSSKLTLAAICALTRNNVSLVRVLPHKSHFSHRASMSVKHSKHKYTWKVF